MMTMDRQPVAAPAPAPAANPPPRRVLIADDNEDVAWTLARWLEAHGHLVEVVHDGLEAVATAERFQPEVILLDIGMPLLDGVDTCRRIRAAPWGQKALIAAVSGWSQPEDEQRSLDAGFDEHLVKPVAAAALLELLARGTR